MTTQSSEMLTIAAVRESILELGLTPLNDEVVERVIEYGLGAVIECTLAMDQPLVIDANLRAVIYARSVERIGQSVAMRFCEKSPAWPLQGSTLTWGGPPRSVTTPDKPLAAAQAGVR